MVDHAIAEYAKQGQSVLEDMNDPYGEYRRGALYIFVVGTDGITKANAGNTTAVGDHVDEVLDVDGSSIGVRMRQIASEDGAWMTYSFTNPATGKVQTKHSWVRLHQDLIFGSGFYDE